MGKSLVSKIDRTRVVRWAVAAVAVGAVGWLGYSWGSASGPHGPAVAAEPAAQTTDTPEISDPAARPAPAAGTGRDALTPDEVARARSIALDAGLRSGAADVAGAPGAEMLSVALSEDDHGAVRRATVLVYDYRSDRLIKQVVDLTAGRLDKSVSAQRMQPPPTEHEIAAAAGLLWDDDAAALLRERFQASTGTALTSLDQVTVEAQTYSADAGDHGPLAGCGMHRCLVLLPRPADRPFLDLTDLVVDLSARTVVRAGA